MSKSAWGKQSEPPKATTSRPEMQTLNVVYKCGHEGKRREIVFPHVGVSHTLSWIKNNVKCGECYAVQALQRRDLHLSRDG